MAQSVDGKVFKVGDACIIEVDRVNTPQGVWWGRVTAVNPEDTTSVEVVINGGRLAWAHNGGTRKPVQTTEQDGVVPHVNCMVYPNTESVRNLFYELQCRDHEIRQLKDRLAQFKEDAASLLGRALQLAGISASEKKA